MVFAIETARVPKTKGSRSGELMLTTRDYVDLDATGLAERIRAGETTALEAMEKAIELADLLNPSLNAIVSRDDEHARAVASAASSDTGFAGAPSFLKDNENLEGLPTRHGSLSTPAVPANHSSPFARQFMAAGLTVLGKTALPEFGLTATTESIAQGPTRNPWNLDHSPGGSSGGSAAAVAAGIVPVAHGNDGGGSIRIPSSCCGLIGIKSSRGRLLSAEGAENLPIDIVSQGILGRSVRDTARFLAEGEKFRRDRSLPELGYIFGPGKTRLRIGVYSERDDGTPSHPDVAAAVEAAGRHCESLGHHVEATKNPFSPKIMEDFIIYWTLLPLALGWLGKFVLGRGFDASKLDPWSKGLTRIANRNLFRFPFVVSRLKRFAREYAQITGKYDILVCPVLSEPPIPLGTISPNVPFDTQLDRVLKYACFTIYQNIAGTPAISLPIGQSETGLPIGIQFAGPMGGDATLLELAYELEQAHAWKQTRAPLLEKTEQILA
jgi:amidase